MSSAVTEASTWEASVIGPDDGDARNAASVRAGLEDLGNRTKYLYDNKAGLATANTFAGAAVFSAGVDITGGATIDGLETDSILLTGSNHVTGTFRGYGGGYIVTVGYLLPDGNDTLFDSSPNLSIEVFHVPQISAARTLTFSATNVPTWIQTKRVRVVRTRTADAYAVVIKRSGGTTIAQIDASGAGWVDFLYADIGTTDWHVDAWGGSVSNIYAGI